jgi:hypothetical protein
MQNEIGQILLDPVNLLPADEAWIYLDRAKIRSIKRGIAQIEAGQLVSIDLSTDEDAESSNP